MGATSPALHYIFLVFTKFCVKLACMLTWKTFDNNGKFVINQRKKVLLSSIDTQMIQVAQLLMKIRRLKRSLKNRYL